MESLLEYNSKFIGTSQRVNPELYKGIVKKVRKYYRKNSPLRMRPKHSSRSPRY